MADQYDDGRYDSGYTELPGGWSIHNSQLPGHPLGLPITAVRGGIQYPKRNTMETNTERAARRVAEKTRQIEKLTSEIDQILIAESRPEPSSNQSRWAIDVRFSRTGKLYQYLVLRVGGKYYTTGGGEHAMFPSWKALLQWLDQDVVEHSAMIPLESNYSAGVPLEGKRS